MQCDVMNDLCSTCMQGKRRTRISWIQVRAVYHALPDYERERLAAIRFEEVLSIEVTQIDTPLLYALHER